MERGLKFDQIGRWSEVKLDIVREYAVPYSRIMTSQGFYHLYIDAFAGAGVHISKATGEFVPGSPLNALSVRPPFCECHFIDLDGRRAEHLRTCVAEALANPSNQPEVFVYEADCHDVLLNVVFPRARYEERHRALCLLDPYGLDLSWDIVRRAGEMRSVDIFLNFPIMDMNRNALWRDPAGVDEADRQRMTRFWGDESWREAAYRESLTLFGPEDEKAANEAVAGAFRARLQDVAGFAQVPKPIPMRNKTNAVIYYLFFASQNAVGNKIASFLFNKYGRGEKGA
jgi:three-Cys-motif partner protein